MHQKLELELQYFPQIQLQQMESRDPLTVVVCFHDELPLPNCADACAYCYVCPLAILILVCFAAAGFIPVQGALLR